jgi:carbamate kinase
VAGLQQKSSVPMRLLSQRQAGRDDRRRPLIILTAVEKAALHFGTSQQRWLDGASVDDARRYIREGHFAPGSMLPKIEAAVEFAASRPGRRTLITLLGKAREGIEGRTGTLIG